MNLFDCKIHNNMKMLNNDKIMIGSTFYYFSVLFLSSLICVEEEMCKTSKWYSSDSDAIKSSILRHNFILIFFFFFHLLCYWSFKMIFNTCAYRTLIIIISIGRSLCRMNNKWFFFFAVYWKCDNFSRLHS